TLGMAAACFAVLAVEKPSIVYPLSSGLLLGLMTSFRPLDAVAAAMAAGCILAAWAPRRILSLAAVTAGGIVGSIPMLWFNARTNGSPTTFGYTVLWGPQHSLGFHDVPFGVPL